MGDTDFIRSEQDITIRVEALIVIVATESS
jgi:hypothetical protein